MKRILEKNIFEKILLGKNTHRKKIISITALAAIVMFIWIIYASQGPETVSIPKPKSDWTESSSPGGLHQGKSFFAVSARTSPVHQLDFPYHEITVSLGFGCDASDEWIYAAFSEAPNIANAEIEEELNTYVSEISFSNGLDDADEYDKYIITQKFGSRFFHFKKDDLIAARIVESASMTLKLDWYKEGFVRFKFSLAGSADVIASAREKCAQL